MRKFKQVIFVAAVVLVASVVSQVVDRVMDDPVEPVTIIREIVVEPTTFCRDFGMMLVDEEFRGMLPVFFGKVEICSTPEGWTISEPGPSD